MAIADPAGGLELAKDHWISFPDGYRAHQIRLDGGDCSTDSIGLIRSGLDWSLAGLWLAVISSGLFCWLDEGDAPVRCRSRRRCCLRGQVCVDG